MLIQPVDELFRHRDSLSYTAFMPLSNCVEGGWDGGEGNAISHVFIRVSNMHASYDQNFLPEVGEQSCNITCVLHNYGLLISNPGAAIES